MAGISKAERERRAAAGAITGTIEHTAGGTAVGIQTDGQGLPPVVQPTVATVKMVRDQPQHKRGPVTACVHPDEVANYQRGGWNLAE